jgi:type IV secretory pathway VirB3-like protein
MGMNYLLALLVPPLAILFAGRPIVAIVALPIWLVASIFSFGAAHVMFILLAWILIYQAHEDRRIRRRN